MPLRSSEAKFILVQTRTGQSTEVQDNDMESVRKTFKGISLALGAA